ncbi:hypothetical protein [Pseudomonas fluorescens]|uniref:hypothetical protein n=1 Tax=Pseudomonas fluorescens TaxID=294 RepID=UPI0012405A94|nr:hypothetical protein [Pseudomonas fluorescens]
MSYSLATLPTTIPDGDGFHRYQTSGDVFEYTGQFKNSAPNGQGSARSYNAQGQLTSTCKGEFATSNAQLSSEGELFRPNGTVIFKGQLSGNLVLGIGCQAGPKGLYISPTGWTLNSNEFFIVGAASGVWVRPGPCTVGDPQGNTWTGNCNLPSQSKHAAIQYNNYPQAPSYSLPELEFSSNFLRFTSGGIEQFKMATGPGVMRFANGEQVEGNFDLGHLEDGLVKVTAADGKVFQAIASNGKLGPRQLAPEQLASIGQICGFPGWRIVSGRCEHNTWSGDVDAYDATGMERISGSFKMGMPSGTITWSRLDSGLQVRGKMVANNGGLGFTQGEVSVAGVQAYEGEMSGFAPNGNGICTVSGSPERCEFAQGERVDVLYKTRLENDRLRGEIAANQQAQRRTQQQAAARQQAAAEAEDDSGDMFGKVLAIGIGAGAVSSVSGVSSTIRNQMITGMAADILTDGKAGAIATAQRNLGVQSSAGSMQPVLSTLSGATMSNNGTLKGSSAVGSNAGGDASTATLQNIAGMGSTAGHAERSQKLDDIVAKVAADSGMKTRNVTYRCAPGDPEQSVTVPYKTEACAAAKENWFSVYACNDVEHMSAANQQCIQGCGNANCDEQ